MEDGGWRMDISALSILVRIVLAATMAFRAARLRVEDDGGDRRCGSVGVREGRYV